MNKKNRPEWFIAIREFIKKIFRTIIDFIIPVKKVKFFWQDAYNEYFKTHDLKTCTAHLLDGMDNISKEYVDFFVQMMPYWNKYRIAAWANPDKRLEKEYKKFVKKFKQPFPKILYISPYLFFNVYGLRELPNEVFNNINNSGIIIDAGGMNGDTAVMLHKYFPNPQIHIYEPLSVNIAVINEILKCDNMDNKIIPIQKGLGERNFKAEISFNSKETADIVSIDETYKNRSERIGLIKSDTEGYETSIIEGAKEIIKRDKPVLSIAIYHTPFDFFELKDKIQKINPEYNFIIRRSEKIIPLADFVLVAY